MLEKLAYSLALVATGAVSVGAQCLIPESQIVSGGVGRDGIPALTTPEIVSVEEGDRFLEPDDLILGVVVNGEARAYPHAVLWWHEIVNDVLGGKPIAVTFCPLTGSGLVFHSTVEDSTFNFGVSGLLFDNNLILFDRTTGTLWSQMRIQAICGSLRETPLELLPVVQSTWSAWKALHPETTTLSFNTGFNRNYNRYPYGSYDQLDNNDLLFPHSFIDRRRPMKETVLGMTHDGVSRAYPTGVLEAVSPRGVVNDVVNGKEILVVFDVDTALMIPYSRRLVPPTSDSEQEAPDEGEAGQLLTFDAVETGTFPFELRDRETGSVWSLTGEALEGELAGARLRHLPTYSAFWFAWASFNRDTEIYAPKAPEPTTSP